MCGIAGIITPPGQEPNAKILVRMTRTLSRRGPDAEGFFIDPKGGCGLGHRRLSIIDLSGGRQPLSSHNNCIHAVVNGEIYNFQDLRKDLIHDGYKFRTNSDSEVVLYAYAKWGTSFVEKIDGMFAIALWDSVTQTLILARDRMGKKPLYYAFVGEAEQSLIFASELKALAEHPALKREINPNSLASYLTYECLPEDQALYSKVRKLLPATSMVYQAKTGRAQFQQFWQMNFINEELDRQISQMSEDEIASELRRRIQLATRARLISDVPLGVFLSGGIDSSIVAAAMVKEKPSKSVKTFSIAFEDKSFDESTHARLVARHLGTEHHEERLSPQTMIDILPEISAFMCEPIGDASIIPTYLLSRFVRRSVTVALGGDGGDELFLGYPTFQADRVARQLDRFLSRSSQRWLGLKLRDLANQLPVSHKNFSLDFKVKRFAQGLGFQPEHRHQAWMGSFLPDEMRNILAYDYYQRAQAQSPYSLIPSLRTDRDFRDYQDRLSYQYARFYLTSCVLVKVDRASMACGLEVRAPLLDTNVVNWATALPGHFKLRGMTTKYILKQAAREWLPKEIIDRPKKGFGIPVGAWLRGPLKSYAHDLLTSQSLRNAGYFNEEAIQQMLSEHQEGLVDHRKALWTLLAFAAWHNHYGPGTSRAMDDASVNWSSPDQKGFLRC